jgi:hypothetical protein
MSAGDAADMSREGKRQFEWRIVPALLDRAAAEVSTYSTKCRQLAALLQASYFV